jgi:sucrose phosphorylase
LHDENRHQLLFSGAPGVAIAGVASGLCLPFGVEILPEVHEHYSYHQKISAHGYWTYDFSLPMLVLHTLYHHTSRVMRQWLAICPRKQITTLDTHDGIGVVDVQDLLSP